MAASTENETEKHDNVLKTTDFSKMKDSIEFRYGIYVMLATVIFFQLIRWTIKSQGPPKPLKGDEVKWRNLYVSWFHALIVSIWAILSSVLYPDLFVSPLFHVTYFTYFNVAFSTGYFLYDFLDMIVSNTIFTMWEVSLHHIVIGGMFYCHLYIIQSIGFNVMALMVEVNSLFLHWRKLLQMVQTSYSSRYYLIIKHLNLITLIFFRIGDCLYITWCVYAWRQQLTTTYIVLISSTMIFMDILNPILFLRIIRSDLLKSSRKESSTIMGMLCRDFALMFGDSSHQIHNDDYPQVMETPMCNNNVFEKNLKED